MTIHTQRDRERERDECELSLVGGDFSSRRMCYTISKRAMNCIDEEKDIVFF